MRRVVVLLGICLSAVPTAVPARAQTPVCEQSLPAATAGAIAVDRAAVTVGQSALVVLSGFRRWPAGLVGGGSGETFLSCVPWTPQGKAEVMPQAAAVFFLIPVPARTAPGSHHLSVVFREGSTQPSGDGRLVRLSTTLRVTGASTAPGPSPACRATLPAAPGGRLVAPSGAAPGTTVSLRITGVAPARLGLLNEYDRHRYVVCVADRASTGTDPSDGTASFGVRIPTAAPPGRYQVRVFGVLESRVVSWSQALVVRGVTPATTPPGRTAAPSPTSAPTAVAPTPSGTAVSTPAPPLAAAPSSSDRWWFGGLGAVLAAAAALGVWVRLRRRTG